MSYFTHIFFAFFLAFLQPILIKTYTLHYFYHPLYSETTNRGEITVTTTFTSGLDLCIFQCFKHIVYQINSFALIAKWFPSTFIILVPFFVWNYRVSHHARPPLRAPSWILTPKETSCYILNLYIFYNFRHITTWSRKLRDIWLNRCRQNCHVKSRVSEVGK